MLQRHADQVAADIGAGDRTDAADAEGPADAVGAERRRIDHARAGVEPELDAEQAKSASAAAISSEVSDVAR